MPADPTQWPVLGDENANPVTMISGSIPELRHQCVNEAWPTAWWENPGEMEWSPGQPLDISSRRLATRRFCLRTRDGINVAGDLQIVPKDARLQRSVISIGQVCNRGNIITFRSASRAIPKEFTFNRIEF